MGKILVKYEIQKENIDVLKPSIVGFYKMINSSGVIRWFVRLYDGRGIYKKELDVDRLEEFFKTSYARKG